MDHNTSQSQSPPSPITSQNPPTPPIHGTATPPSIPGLPFNRTKLLIFLGIFVFLLLLVGIFISIVFFTKNTNSSVTETVTPPSEQTRKDSPTSSTKTWQVEIVYSPSDSTYHVERITLQDEPSSLSGTESSSPYVLSILDDNNQPLYTTTVSIATNFILPDIFKNSSASAGFENTPLTTVINIPYIERGAMIRINHNQTPIIQVRFPTELQARINSSQYILGESTQPSTPNEAAIATGQNISPVGWELSVTPICEDGKAFAKYTYNIPEYAGVVFTYDQTDTGESLHNLRDSSWQKSGLGLVLLSGKGTYTARGNLMSWNPSMGQLVYNGPVGLLQNSPYRGTLMLSGDWTCTDTTNRPGCVPGESPTQDYIEKATVTVTFNTPSTCAAPTPTDIPGHTPTPTTTPQGLNCVPDPRCAENKESLQICQLICN